MNSWQNPGPPHWPVVTSRRDFLMRAGGGCGGLALTWLLAREAQAADKKQPGPTNPLAARKPRLEQHVTGFVGLLGAENLVVARDQPHFGVGDRSRGRQRVLVAVTENDLTTNVGGGENGGRVLKHSAVVRELHPLGTTSNGKFETTVDLAPKSDWKKQDLRAIVLVQNTSSGLILGAASIPYSLQGSTSLGR